MVFVVFVAFVAFVWHSVHASANVPQLSVRR